MPLLRALLLLLASLSAASADTIVVKGSINATAPLASAAPKLRAQGIDLKIDTQHNSSTAIAAVGEGGVDLAVVTRAVTSEERAAYPAVRFEVTPLGYQLLALVVSSDVWQGGVRALSREQVQMIYESSITNWKQLGGPDQPIKYFNPEPGRGVWEVFATWLYGDPRKADPGDRFEQVSTGEETRNVVEFNAGALSVVSPLRIDGKGTFALSIKTDAGELQPSVEGARTETYPISRRFDLVTPKRPIGPMRKLLEFLRSPDGQQLLRQHDLYPAEEK